MFERGLVDEIDALDQGRLSLSARQLIGIKEIKSYFDGDCDLDKVKELMKQNTRHFAKRQLTWFRKEKRIEWVNVNKSSKPADILGQIERIIQ